VLRVAVYTATEFEDIRDCDCRTVAVAAGTGTGCLCANAARWKPSRRPRAPRVEERQLLHLNLPPAVIESAAVVGEATEDHDNDDGIAWTCADIN
jgi:hypothetical protein